MAVALAAAAAACGGGDGPRGVTPVPSDTPGVTASAQAPAADGPRGDTAVPSGTPNVTASAPTPAADYEATLAPGSSDPETILRSAVASLKGAEMPVTVTQSSARAADDDVFFALGLALSQGGTAYFGTYGAGDNEVVVVRAPDGSGTLVLLSEPGVALPADVAEAWVELPKIFPRAAAAFEDEPVLNTNYFPDPGPEWFIGGYLSSYEDAAVRYEVGIFTSRRSVVTAFIVFGTGSYKKITGLL